MRRVRAAAVTLALATVPVVGLQTGAIALTATKVTLYGSKVSDGKEHISAALAEKANSYGIGGKTLVFKYYKKSGTSWTLRAKHSVTTSGMGLASTSFSAPSAGTCKVVAKFAGNTKYAASKDSQVMDCATGK